MTKHIICTVAVVLAAIGAINWGLRLLKPSTNLVHMIAGKKDSAGKLVQNIPENDSYMEKVIYGLVAVGGIVALACLFMKDKN
jgi:uncharacterized membrane protein YuzA (DUF378 family)